MPRHQMPVFGDDKVRFNIIRPHLYRAGISGYRMLRQNPRRPAMGDDKRRLAGEGWEGLFRHGVYLAGI